MNYGLYLSATGALASIHRQSVYANNLANSSTVGFKPDQVFIRQRLPERLESSQTAADPKWMLEQIGGGVYVEPTRVNLAQGGIVQTGNDLDVAIDGDGMFVVADGMDERLTRDGRFTLDSESRLVMAGSGLRVLDDRGRPIALDAASQVRIDGEGAIMQDGKEVARLRVVSVLDPSALRKDGDNLLALKDGVDPGAALGAASGRLRQGHTESSAVDAIMTMNDMISAAKAAQANLKMMQYHDHILGQAFNTIGRVA